MEGGGGLSLVPEGKALRREGVTLPRKTINQRKNRATCYTEIFRIDPLLITHRWDRPPPPTSREGGASFPPIQQKSLLRSFFYPLIITWVLIDDGVTHFNGFVQVLVHTPYGSRPHSDNRLKSSIRSRNRRLHPGFRLSLCAINPARHHQKNFQSFSLERVSSA